MDLQREHSAETRRQQEEIASLKKRLAEAESGGARDEELREVKRLAYERERELRRTHAERLSETELEAERRVSALQAQRESDNRSLMDVHTDEKARLEEELQSLRLRRDSEARVYGERIEELARERAEERTSLEEAVAKLREKHEAERARLQERVEILEEYLEEQESITVRLLGELGYVNGSRPELTEAPSPTGELEVAGRADSETKIQQALSELRGIAAPGNLLREGLALFNETEHAKGSVCRLQVARRARDPRCTRVPRRRTDNRDHAHLARYGLAALRLRTSLGGRAEGLPRRTRRGRRREHPIQATRV